MIQSELEKEEEDNIREHLKRRGKKKSACPVSYCGKKWQLDRHGIICYRAFYFYSLIPEKLMPVQHFRLQVQ